MPGYDARFWELPFDPDTLANVPADLFATADDEAPSDGARIRRQVLAELAEVVRSRLTVRQREIVELYFFAGRTQQEIAAELGISQQAVSRQLFGVVRDGRRVGGAINRLRRIAVEQGWDPSEWV
jgi:DNA-directed RNA polymerase specialized sigma24 family protein